MAHGRPSRRIDNLALALASNPARTFTDKGVAALTIDECAIKITEAHRIAEACRVAVTHRLLDALTLEGTQLEAVFITKIDSYGLSRAMEAGSVCRRGQAGHLGNRRRRAGRCLHDPRADGPHPGRLRLA